MFIDSVHYKYQLQFAKMTAKWLSEFVIVDSIVAQCFCDLNIQTLLSFSFSSTLRHPIRNDVVHVNCSDMRIKCQFPGQI